jgi:hypothetical protein
MAEVDNYVEDLTGGGLTDGPLAMYGADLGIPRWDAARNANAVMFGDNFQFRYLQGAWRGPSIVMYGTNFNPVGIPTANPIGVAMQPVAQLWPYQHGNPEYSTILPTDFIQIGGTWYVSVMVTQGLGNELRTEFWRSPDLVNWSGPVLSLPHPSHPGNVMLTFDVIGSYVYIFGTGGLVRNQPLWLWRNPVDQFPLGWWEPWGWDGNTWDWGIPNENTPVLAGQFGEICFRYLGGQTVLSYFDAGNYKMTALVVDTPWSDLYAATSIDYAFGWSTPQIYGGYIWPQSVLDDPNGMKFSVSQWNTMANDPYHVMLFQDTLASGVVPFARARAAGMVSRVAAAPPVAAVGGVSVAAVKGIIGGIRGAAAGIRDGWATGTRSMPAVAGTAAGRRLNRRWAGNKEASSPRSNPSVQAKTVAQPAAMARKASQASRVTEAPAVADSTAPSDGDKPTGARAPKSTASRRSNRSPAASPTPATTSSTTSPTSRTPTGA